MNLDNDNSLKSRISSSLYAVIFIIALLFEFYWITTDPYDYFMIIGIGAIAIIMGYLAFESIMINYNKVQHERHEQNEILIKTQKALYLATKKNNAAREVKSAQDFEALKYMMERIIENQRALNDILGNGKYAQNRINAQNTDSDNLAELIDKLSETNEKYAKNLANEVRAAVVSELVKSNEEFVSSVLNVLDKGAVNAATDDVPVEDSDTDDVDITTDSATDIPDDIPDVAFDVNASENHEADFESENIDIDEDYLAKVAEIDNIAGMDNMDDADISDSEYDETSEISEMFDLDSAVDQALNNIIHSSVSSEENDD